MFSYHIFSEIKTALKIEILKLTQLFTNPISNSQQNFNINASIIKRKKQKKNMRLLLKTVENKEDVLVDNVKTLVNISINSVK